MDSVSAEDHWLTKVLMNWVEDTTVQGAGNAFRLQESIRRTNVLGVGLCLIVLYFCR